MAKTFEQRQSLVARRMAQGAGVTCVALHAKDAILEKLPKSQLPGSELLPEAQRTVEVWHEWTGDAFATAYGL